MILEACQAVVMLCAMGFVWLMADAAICELRVRSDRRNAEAAAIKLRQVQANLVKQERAKIPRAQIIRVGIARAMAFGGVRVEGWEFERTEQTPVSYILPNGDGLYCGYTAAELLEISRRPSEFIE